MITHHYPHKNSTAPQFEGNAWTAFLGSQLPEDLLLQAGLRIHGHTHHSVNFRLDAQVNGVKRYLPVICNPRGYPLGRTPGNMENPKFNPALLMAQLPDGNWAPSNKP